MKQMNKNNNQQPFIVALECTKGSTVDWGRLRTPGAGVISAKTGEDDDGISRAHRGRHPASRSSSPPAPPPFLDRPAFESRRRRQMAPSSPS